ncbi:galactose-1-phosphate uridylyltransferase [Candidatus Omnitrophota bacterium]
MAELRRDPINSRWVIVDVDSPKSPESFEKEHYEFTGEECPFCYGNEQATTPEIDVFRFPETKPNTPGWQVRVVSNKYPALKIEGALDSKAVGIYDMSNGVGAHEVIIDSPYHKQCLVDLLDNEAVAVIDMYRKRTIELLKDKRFKYILIFKNHGPSAGASIEHDHTQLIALPMVPKNVQEELSGTFEYFHSRERCLFCDIIAQEFKEKARIVQESQHFIALCPYAPRFPFETWILPKKHNALFHTIGEPEKRDLAKILKDMLARLQKVLYNPAYNFTIHTAPAGGEYAKSYHWHIEIMPKLTRVAGFEWGTGFYIVPTPPEVAVHYLREVTL